jgi:hypothetical protein
VGLILFMHVAPAARGYRRRVASLWESDGQGGHRMVFRWNRGTDTFEHTGELREPASLKRHQDFLQGLLDAGDVEMEAVRRKFLSLHEEKEETSRNGHGQKSRDGRE